MLIIGERINTSRKRVAEAYERRDADYIRREALLQAEAGADVIDVNAGSGVDVEPENMAWAVKTIQDVVDLPLCIDSPNPAAIRAGLQACQNPQAAWADSITLEKARIDGILPVCREVQSFVIALCRDDNGVPRSARERVEVAKRLVETVNRYGIRLDKLYLDPMVEPVSLRNDAGLVALHALRGLKEQLPEIKTVISLSGISFGLPRRKLLHRAYLPMLMYEQLDAIFLDPSDLQLMIAARAARTVLGQDEYCIEYITAHRDGKLRDHSRGISRKERSTPSDCQTQE